MARASRHLLRHWQCWRRTTRSTRAAIHVSKCRCSLYSSSQKFPVDLRCSLVHIFGCYPANKSPNLLAHLGSAAARPRSPAPVQAKTRPMPSDHRIRFHNDQNIRPTWPYVPQSGPEDAVERFREGRGRFRLRTATCCRSARTSSEVSTRLLKKTRIAARNAVIKSSTNQPL